MNFKHIDHSHIFENGFCVLLRYFILGLLKNNAPSIVSTWSMRAKELRSTFVRDFTYPSNLCKGESIIMKSDRSLAPCIL